MKLYGAFAKIDEQEDGTLIVSGIASSEAVDSDGEVVKASAIEAALPDYMRFGAVREMHGASAAGTAIEAKVDDTGKTEFSAHIVDPVAVKKVQTGTYKGFSIGGRVLKRDAADPKVITELRLTEISLVDRPANPDAMIQLCKFDDGEGEGDPVASDATETKTAAAAATDPAQPSGTTVAGNGQRPAAVAVATDGAAKADAPVIAKSMYMISTLADLLTNIQFLAMDAAWEAQCEGDNSEAPAKIRAWLSAGVEILKDVVAEETSEMTAAAESIVLADAPTDVTKAGARHSKVDMEAIQAVHDHAVSLGAGCASMDAEKIAKLAKLAAPVDVADAIAKVAALEGERDALKKRVTELEAEPAAPKGKLRVVAKGEDVAAPDADASKAEITDDDDPLTAMKKVHASGGTRLH